MAVSDAPAIVNMLTPADIRDLCLRKYPALLRSIVDGEEFFPLPIRFGKPSTATAFAQLRQEIEALATSNVGYRIEWKEVRSPRLALGRQKLPEKVWFDSEVDFLQATGKAAEVARFRAQLAETRMACPELVPWMRQRPLAAIEQRPFWAQLLQVCLYLKSNPRPGCYTRELPLSVGTKFLDEHQAVLRELLTMVLPAAHVQLAAPDFETRFGFKREEPSIRVRVLDQSSTPAGWPPAITDFSLPQSGFSQLNWPAPRVLVVENKFTFLTLPQLSGVLAIWGAGYAAELLTPARWLKTKELCYWGDLDEAGFHILSRLRHEYPSARSVMMDAETLAKHSDWAIPGPAHGRQDLEGLTEPERELLADLCRRQLRLEQEKLPHAFVVDQLTKAFGSRRS